VAGRGAIGATPEGSGARVEKVRILGPAGGMSAGPAESLKAQGSGLIVADGQGGVLLLDLASPGLRWLVDACRSLLTGRVPAGASMVKVRAGDEVYVLNLRPREDGPADLHLSNLYDPAQDVLLTRDRAEALVTLLDVLMELYAPPAGDLLD
jgi:hypothetical protein